MSFITRCPSCSTSFKVVADQLRVSQGWVRCGHCAEIFDANQDIKPWAPTPPVLTNVVDEPLQAPEHAAPQEEGPPHPDGGHALAEQLDDAATPEAVPVDLDPVLHIDVLQADIDEPLHDTPLPEPRFVKQARRQAFWASRRVRGALWLGVGLACLILTFQWAVHDRDRLAAWQPALKPLLTAVCQPLACRIESVRQLDAVVIESSGLVRLLGQLHAMDVVLKNTQSWPVAMPSLELSLTDAQEQVLARRVLLAQDWPDAPAVLEPGQAWPVKLRLSIALPADQSMAGYRMVLFYP